MPCPVLIPSTYFTNVLSALDLNINFALIVFFCNYTFRSQFCTCHDSLAIVACAIAWPEEHHIWRQNYVYFVVTRVGLWAHKLFGGVPVVTVLETGRCQCDLKRRLISFRLVSIVYFSGVCYLPFLFCVLWYTNRLKFCTSRKEYLFHSISPAASWFPSTTRQHARGLMSTTNTQPWDSSKIRKIAGCACAGNARNISTLPRISAPDMHHCTCVTHVPWCMLG